MTTRERIAVLRDNGIELHLIAALLNLDVDDVAVTLADPDHTPTDPSGGDTRSTSALTRWIWLAAQLGDQTGANQYPTAIGLDSMIPVLDPSAHKATEMTQSPSSSVGYAKPGGTVLFQALAELLGWADGDQVSLEVGPCVLWSLSGERWVTFDLAPITLDSTAPNENGTVKHNYTADDVTITHQSGEEFSVGSEQDLLVSAEGGAFMVACFCYAQVVS